MSAKTILDLLKSLQEATAILHTTEYDETTKRYNKRDIKTIGLSKDSQIVLRLPDDSYIEAVKLADKAASVVTKSPGLFNPETIPALTASFTVGQFIIRRKEPD